MNATVATTQEVSHKPDFSTLGAYRQQAESLHHQLVNVFKLSGVKAEKCAKQIVRDFTLAKSSMEVSFKTGKSITKDNKGTIIESGKLKGVTFTNALNTLHALEFAATAGKHGLSYLNTVWTPNDQLKAYFAEL